MLRARTALFVLAVGTSGCALDRSAAPSFEPQEHEVANVVARVGDQTLGASEVAARMAADGVDARTALEALVDEVLLVNEARRRDITLDREGERAVERMMVRAMLHDFEAELTPESVPDAEVRADFEAQRENLQIPERRRSWHILVRDSTDAGRKLARSIQSEVLEAEDPRTVFERYAAGASLDTTLEVTAEELPPISRKAPLETPYKDALFAARTTGPLDQLVKTKYGWHVIVLTEVLPAEARSLEDVEGEIRLRLSQKKRFENLLSVVRARQADGLVTYDDDGVALLLAMPGLPERAQ